jgi:hypothetical protein
MRDNLWLNAVLQELLSGAFSDIERPEQIRIRFGIAAKNRFGSIRWEAKKQQSSVIINGVFKDLRIPEEIVKATLAHELCHYVHGYGSQLPKKYANPHQGGVILRELKARGLERRWSKQVWPSLARELFHHRLQPRVRRSVRQPSLATWIRQLVVGF